MLGGDLFSKNPGTESDKKDAGKVLGGQNETGIHVKTGDGILVIEELQLEGKKRNEDSRFPAWIYDRAGYKTWRIKAQRNLKLRRGTAQRYCCRCA